jgi:hypothetical protein
MLTCREAMSKFGQHHMAIMANLKASTIYNPQPILPQINSFPYVKCINQYLLYLIWSIRQGIAVFGVPT